MKAPLPTTEQQRLDALRAFRILDSPAEADFDDVVAIASEVCDTPIALVSLVDEDRQWFKARKGLAISETPREQAFCAHAILGSQPLIVPDASQDGRFRDNPLVLGDPNIRFYAGAPLTTSDGHALGTLCVIDDTARDASPLTDGQVDILERLAKQVVRLMELRRASAHLAEALANVKLLAPLVPICAWCRRIRDDDNYWATLEEYLGSAAGVGVTHGICEPCLSRMEAK